MNHLITILVIAIIAAWTYGAVYVSELFFMIPLALLMGGAIYGLIYVFISDLRAKTKTRTKSDT